MEKENITKNNNTLESKERFIPKVGFKENILDNKEENFIFSQIQKNILFLNMLENLPDLQQKIKNKEYKNSEDLYEILKTNIKQKREELKDELIQERQEIEKEWNKISEKFLNRLSHLLETEWEKEKNITAFITILRKKYPRYLNDYSFFISNKGSLNSNEVIAHEILHFLWFKKWKETFPETEKKEMENPNLVWKISEIMDPIILQTDPEIKKIINPTSWGYPSFKDLKINNISMQEYFTKIYSDSRNIGDSFDMTMKKIYKEAKIHEKELNF